MTATLARFLADPVPQEVARALDLLVQAPDVVHVAVMPDVHLAEEVCVGVALATTRLIYPAAVGGDIGCGMAAVRVDAPAGALDRAAAARVLAELYDRVPRGRHRRAAWRPWPSDLQPDALSAPPLAALARSEGRAQLGTLGSGNHFIELQADDQGALWIMLHSGSRGLGPAIRQHHAAATEPAGALRAVDAETDQGQAYLADMRWALRYADANREHLLAATEEALAVALGASTARDSLITCQHNHARREVHGDRPLWVHRKGAMPAAAGELGVVPGSMGTPSYHVEGRGLPAALCSSAHGAGRAMSRSEARRRVSPRDLHRQLDGVAWDHRRADLLRDEAPTAYKDIQRVMRAQGDLVRIVRRLRPLLSYKAAAN
jgi:tRNA-splicing ligase RtcB (3'-phosphate/5'-hydroxy nucleic acid ligase)